LLGEETLKRASEEVRSEFAADIDPRLWKMLLSGEDPLRDEHGMSTLPKEEMA